MKHTIGAKTIRHNTTPQATGNKLLFLTHLDNKTGYSQQGIRIASGLVKLKYDIEVSNLAKCDPDKSVSEIISSRICQTPQRGVPTFVVAPLSASIQDGIQKTLLMTNYESTVPPRDGVDLCNSFSAIVVNSSWNRESFWDSGVTRPIHVVPLGIDCDDFPNRPFHNGPFTFITGGRIIHGLVRKGISDVIRAFLMAFEGNNNVRLIVKISEDDPLESVSDGRIQVIRKYLTTRQLSILYGQSHVFVTATRGEGWGLMPHQAMATGRPVIAPFWAGIGEYADESCGFPVEYSLADCYGPYAGHGQWAVPNIYSLIDQMRFAYDNPSEVAIRGHNSVERARFFSWDKTVNDLIPIIKTYCFSKTRPSSTSFSFYHSGDIGDLIYSMPTIKALGGGDLILGPATEMPESLKPRLQFNKSQQNLLQAFLLSQKYIKSVSFSDAYASVDYDLNKFRYYWHKSFLVSTKRIQDNLGKISGPTLMSMHAAAFNVTSIDDLTPWLSFEKTIITGKPVIIHRSPRYHNPAFPWKDIVDKYGKGILFVGLESEYGDFIEQFGDVDFYSVSDFLDMAQIIAGSTLFIGNQSAPYSIAEGLKVNCIQETRGDEEMPDCIFNRLNAFYCYRSTFEPPELNKLNDFFRLNKFYKHMLLWRISS